MSDINPADRETVARAFIASHADFPSPTDSPAAARYADANARMTAAERWEAFQQFLQVVDSLPGGRLLLEYTKSIH
jgi:hypothetical protein